VCGQHDGPVSLVALHHLPQRAARCWIQTLQRSNWQMRCVTAYKYERE
jgi:hypothetical protein